jgi:hypothetical protein
MIRRGQPVVWVTGSMDRMLLFADNTVACISLQFIYNRLLDLSDSPLVILHDALAGPVHPDAWGNEFRNNYVVVATSHEVEKFSAWIDTGVDCITMDLFTKDEVRWLE